MDQPPLIALITWMARLCPVAAGATEIGLTAIIAREMGGKHFAQSLAAVAALVAPGILATDNLLSMNVFEPPFRIGCAWLLTRIIKTGNLRLWIWFCLLSGIGLENKYSIAMLGGAMFFALLLTRSACCDNYVHWAKPASERSRWPSAAWA